MFKDLKVMYVNINQLKKKFTYWKKTTFHLQVFLQLFFPVESFELMEAVIWCLFKSGES